MGVLDRVNARARRGRGDESRYSIDTWISDYLIPSAGQFVYGGQTYPFGLGPSQTLAGNRAAEIADSLPGYRAALQACPPASSRRRWSARWCCRRPVSRSGTRRGTGRRRGGRSGTLTWRCSSGRGRTARRASWVSRMEWHAGLAGNAFVYRQPGRLRLLRPDWTAILYGSQLEPEWPTGALDAELIGYVYANRGIGAGEPHLLLPSDVAHWAPLPDPEMTGLGMSWLTPAIRDMQGDRLASEHKIRFFEQGATPNLVVKGINAATQEQFNEIVEMVEQGHAGVPTRTGRCTWPPGADATVIGSNLAELDLAGVQGRNETRLSVLSAGPGVAAGHIGGPGRVVAECGTSRRRGGTSRTRGCSDAAGSGGLGGAGGEGPGRRGAVVRRYRHADPA